MKYTFYGTNFMQFTRTAISLFVSQATNSFVYNSLNISSLISRLEVNKGSK